MTTELTHKQLWRKDKDVEYIRIEARPTVRESKKNKCSVTVEILPPGGRGACKAIQALMQAILVNRGSDSIKFYNELEEFSERWIEKEKS